MSSLTFPTLYMTTKLGKVKLWRVSVKGNSFIRQDHFVDGKVKEPVVRECKTTNEGKANERNPHEQACFEAARAWIRSLDKGYEPSEKDSVGKEVYSFVMGMKTRGETNHNLPILLVKRIRGEEMVSVQKTESGVRTIVSEKSKNVSVKEKAVVSKIIKPMLAEKLEEKRHLFLPVEEVWYIQPKVDGVRCIARRQSSNVVLTTRTGKQFVHLTHIYDNVNKLLTELFHTLKEEVILDGELYTNSLYIGDVPLMGNQRFDKISGACRPIRSKPAPYEEQISYYLFDIVDSTLTQTQRKKRLRVVEEVWNKISTSSTRSIIRFLPYQRVKDMSTVEECQLKWIEMGYEGVILRKGEGLYEQRRSAFLLKYKEFDDEEYEIVGATEGEATEKGCVVWRCKTDDGVEFDARPQGTFEDRKVLYENYHSYIGKMLTVKFQKGKYDEYGVPRFPVGVAIRDYE